MCAESVQAVAPVLDVRAISKRYPGTQALDGASLDVRPGEIHALLGQNGAGKSTLIRILAGVEAADGGEIRFKRELISPGHAHSSIGFIHQDLGLVESMSVAENLALYGGYPMRRGLVSWSALRERARAALEIVDCSAEPSAPVGDLTTSERSLVAIARAVCQQVDMLVLDEPTAALSANDVDTLFSVLRRLREQGVAMLYVTHRLDEVFQLTDRITVLRDGVSVLTAETRSAAPADVTEAIAGRPIEALFPALEAPRPEVRLSVEGLVVGPAGPVDLELRAGEVLGLVGLRGAGHEAIGRALFGLEEVDAGVLEVEGRPWRGKIDAAIADGIGFVSGRRSQEALAGGMAVRENLFLNPRFVDASPVRWRGEERRRAKQALQEFGVRPADPERDVLTLSGGNQQKVVVGRWLLAASDILILEDPTAGVDIGARSELYQLIAEMCLAGRAVILVSSDFDEVAGLAHRALVFDRGRVAAELRADLLSAQAISLYASGEHKAVAQ